MRVRLQNYTGRKTESYVVNIGTTELYFSYETCVAFRHDHQLRVSENVWSTTTGRHLNEIDGGNKKSRLAREEFVADLNETMSKIFQKDS